MAEKRDYYEVLGVDRNATADDIKSAYRKMALKWHPDRWVNGTDAEKKTAEENFKEASEAYSVLSDPDKKARYDRFGQAGLGGDGAPDFSGGFGNLNDILNELFGNGGFGGFSGFGGFGGFGGGQRGGAQQRVMRGRDIRTRVRLTLEEIATGVEKEVTIERNEQCPDCGGKGAVNASDVKTCPVCHGTGQEQRVTNGFFGQTITYTTCSRCGGEGQVVSNPCRNCGGTGLVRKRVSVKVRIPAGVEDGMQLTLKGEGHAAKAGGINGDLLVVIEQIPHQELKREGKNLFYSKIISVTDAILGTEVSIPCLDGNYKIKVEPGTQSGTVVRLRGRGLPAVKGYGSGTGDLYVKYLVWIPKKLKSNEKSALESIRSSDSFKPDLSREDKNLFDKMKENF
ncbi:MAG: molecular chaperone DnaJ [Candidatus Cryptobacteroides sp.]|nr:molecular chaperone DnaJ [Bacteroidales bacterium]MDY3964498.1 molecular chaperone DnaJ [Candidatus Cryptobacteroides sp.]